MKTNIKQLLIIGAGSLLLAGCCTTPRVTQWEYKIVAAPWLLPHGSGSETEGRKNQEAVMNQMGKDGWILVDVTDANYYFKRPLK